MYGCVRVLLPSAKIGRLDLLHRSWYSNTNDGNTARGCSGETHASALAVEPRISVLAGVVATRSVLLGWCSSEVARGL